MTALMSPPPLMILSECPRQTLEQAALSDMCNALRPLLPVGSEAVGSSTRCITCSVYTCKHG
jgi:hypothetical protein